MIQSKCGLGIRFESQVKHRCFISDLFSGGFFVLLYVARHSYYQTTSSIILSQGKGHSDWSIVAPFPFL